MKYIDENGLLYLVQKIKNWDKGKVDKVEGKGLSTNDYDAAAVAKVAASQSASEVEAIVTSKGYQTASDVESIVTGKGYQSANDVEAIVTGKGYQTASDVSSAITAAISGFTGIDFSIVEVLPETGAKGIIYLVSNGGGNSNIYDEYIWVTDKFEKIGTTDVDLSGYLQSADVIAITNGEIDTIITSAK